MATYRSIATTETDPQAPVTSALMKALDANATAIAEGAAGAPILNAAWHPYNRTTMGGSETGLIWSFPVDGAQATITSPDFEDNYEYMFVIEQLRSSSGTAGALQMNLYRETSAAYTGVFGLTGAALTTSVAASGYAVVLRPRQVLKQHQVADFLQTDATNTVVTGLGEDFAAVKHTTAQKLLRAQFSLSTGNINGSGSAGQIYMLRRLAIT